MPSPPLKTHVTSKLWNLPSHSFLSVKWMHQAVWGFNKTTYPDACLMEIKREETWRLFSLQEHAQRCEVFWRMTLKRLSHQLPPCCTFLMVLPSDGITSPGDSHGVAEADANTRAEQMAWSWPQPCVPAMKTSISIWFPVSECEAWISLWILGKKSQPFPVNGGEVDGDRGNWAGSAMKQAASCQVYSWRHSSQSEWMVTQKRACC